MEESCKEFLSILLIKLSSNTVYQMLKTHMHNKGLFDKHAWPMTQDAAYGLLQNFRPEVGRCIQHQIPQQEGGLAFTKRRQMICFGCGKSTTPVHSWRKCLELSWKQKEAILEKLKGGASSKDAVKDAISNVSVGEDGAKKEFIGVSLT